jgi:hypothetical protein
VRSYNSPCLSWLPSHFLSQARTRACFIFLSFYFLEDPG